MKIGLLRIAIAVTIAAASGVVALIALPTASADECSPGYYWSKTHGNCVERPDNNPAGATAQCADGLYSHSETVNASENCSGHGGVIAECPCGATSHAASTPPVTQASVPNMRGDAALGQPCSNSQRFIFGYDANGNVLACAGDVKDGTWVSSAALYGVQQIGAPCASGEGAAQSSDGRALVCVVDMGWQPGP
jgi:hypothetical protein